MVYTEPYSIWQQASHSLSTLWHVIPKTQRISIAEWGGLRGMGITIPIFWLKCTCFWCVCTGQTIKLLLEGNAALIVIAKYYEMKNLILYSDKLIMIADKSPSSMWHFQSEVLQPWHKFPTSVTTNLKMQCLSICKVPYTILIIVLISLFLYLRTSSFKGYLQDDCRWPYMVNHWYHLSIFIQLFFHHGALGRSRGSQIKLDQVHQTCFRGPNLAFAVPVEVTKVTSLSRNKHLVLT